MTPSGTYTAFGDSMTFGQGASDPSKSYARLLAAELGMPLVNKGVPGSAVFEASKQGYIAAGNTPRVDGLFTWMAGFGDLNQGGLHQKTIPKIKHGLRAFLANAFLATAVPASSPLVVKTGSWTNCPSSMFAKSELGLGGYGLTTNIEGDQMVFNFSGTSLVIGSLVADGIFQRMGKVVVAIDGALAPPAPHSAENGYYSGDGQTDGVPNGHDNQRLTHSALVFTGLAPGAHQVIVQLIGTPGVAGNPAHIDYFGTLQDPSVAQPVLVAVPPYMAGPITRRTDRDATARLIHEVVCEFHGYSIRMVWPNDYYTLAGMGPDGIHQNDLGMQQLARCFGDGVRLKLALIGQV